MKSWILPAVSALVLSLAAASIVRTQPRQSAEPPPRDPPQAAYQHRVAASGLVEPRSECISVGVHLPGVVESIQVAPGQDVHRGDPLFKLDTRALESSRREQLDLLRLKDTEIATARTRSRRAAASLSEARDVLRFAEAATEPGSVSAEELSRRRNAVEIAAAELATADAAVASANAAREAAASALRRIETEIERSTVTAPIDGRILQVRIRPGEYAATGTGNPPWLVIGDVSELHVRVDIDEQEAWQIRSEATALAHVRGNSRVTVPLRFVRFEPLVIPKQSLTGASTERVDTRVLQAIYRVDAPSTSLFVGQQMDVFIELPAEPAGLAGR